MIIELLHLLYVSYVYTCVQVEKFKTKNEVQSESVLTNAQNKNWEVCQMKYIKKLHTKNIIVKVLL